MQLVCDREVPPPYDDRHPAGVRYLHPLLLVSHDTELLSSHDVSPTHTAISPVIIATLPAHTVIRPHRVSRARRTPRRRGGRFPSPPPRRSGSGCPPRCVTPRTP